MCCTGELMRFDGRPARSHGRNRAGVLGLWALALMVAVCAFGIPRADAASLPSGFIETEIGGYWDEAAGLTFDSANVMYVWDRQGRVWIVENDVKRATPLID